MSAAAPTIGLLYPGEMGAALTAVLRGRGLRVLTTMMGRSPETAERCRRVGIEVLPALEDVIRHSDVVISVVVPAAAETVAIDYCRLAHLAPATALYVDANSIGPEQVTALGAQLKQAGRNFVDAAVNGLAKNLTTSGTLFLSGERAGEVAGLFAPAVQVRELGDEIGRASAMKMLLGGLSKGVCALFAELALLAERREMLDEMIEESSRIYPGLMQLVERMLPTYAQHAGRRATEMSEVDQTERATGMQPCVIDAVRQLHEELATIKATAIKAADAHGCDVGCDVATFIRRLADEGVLGGGGLVSNGENRSKVRSS